MHLSRFICMLRHTDSADARARILAHELVTTNQPSGKNPAAVALGRLGGLKGGRARAERLTKSERTAIARNAAVARWGKR